MARYHAAMRRERGSGLVRNELRVLTAALDLRQQGVERCYGFELFNHLRTMAGNAPMNHGTLYRCLQSLVRRGLLAAVGASSDDDARVSVYYSLTGAGVTAAQEALLNLASGTNRESWLEIGLLRRLLGPIPDPPSK